jgi:hypothetical protein
MERPYIKAWKQYLAEAVANTPENNKKGTALVDWARDYVNKHKLKRKGAPVSQRSMTQDEAWLETWDMGQGWSASFPESLTHQVEFKIYTAAEPYDNYVDVRVYGAGFKANTEDQVDSHITADQWDAAKQQTIESLVDPHVRK